MYYWFNTPTLWLSIHFVVFQASASLPVWSGSYPFSCFDPFPEFCLQTLLPRVSKEVTLMRFGSLQRIGHGQDYLSGLASSWKLYASTVWIPSLRFTLAITLRSCFIPQRSWDSPCRVFPFLKANRPLERSHPLITLILRQGLRFKTWFARSTVYRVFILHQVRTSKTGFYSGLRAVTLLGFSPPRVCPCPEMERISPFLLPYACSWKQPKQSSGPALRSFDNRSGSLISEEMASSLRVSDLICPLTVNRWVWSGLILFASKN